MNPKVAYTGFKVCNLKDSSCGIISKKGGYPIIVSK
jgi:hypothetical protein